MIMLAYAAAVSLWLCCKQEQVHPTCLSHALLLHCRYGFNMRVIKELAMTEPLVDTVDPEQIASSPCLLRKFDIRTMTKDDATFTAPFSLKASRNDYIHALVAYFDVTFNACHKPVYFSTAPQCRPTHWKQTVFYLEDSLTVCTGEKLTGTISCK